MSGDTRTRREKLEAMANQTESPNEAAIARRILSDMGPEPTVAEPLDAAELEPTRWFRFAFGVSIDEWIKRWEVEERKRRRQEAIARRRREHAAADQAGPNREQRRGWDWTGSSHHLFVPSAGIRCARCGESRAAGVHR